MTNRLWMLLDGHFFPIKIFDEEGIPVTTKIMRTKRYTTSHPSRRESSTKIRDEIIRRKNSFELSRKRQARRQFSVPACVQWPHTKFGWWVMSSREKREVLLAGLVSRPHALHPECVSISSPGDKRGNVESLETPPKRRKKLGVALTPPGDP